VRKRRCLLLAASEVETVLSGSIGFDTEVAGADEWR
jgi:hypothetical protein